MSNNRHGKNIFPQIQTKNRSLPKIENKISVSMCYLSKNKQRNFEFFVGKNLRQREKALSQFVDFVKELTSKTRLEISLKSKFEPCGFENLRYEDVNCVPNNYILSKDTNIAVFRFGDNKNGGDYRILGFFEEKSSVFNIIGFDFDYSAYKH